MEFENSRRLFVTFTEKFSDRRQLARDAINATISGENLETWLSKLKLAIVYDRLDAKAKQSFRTFCKEVRHIHRGWKHLTAEERFEFLDGSTPYSKIASVIRGRSNVA